MTKRLVTISLFIFWAFVVSIGVAALIRYDEESSMSTGVVNQVDNIVTITASVVAEHGSSDNCWVIVQDNVYDVTKFINKHPGGSEAILPYCGKDGTNAFLTKNQDPAQPHKSEDLSVLNNYKIGPLK